MAWTTPNRVRKHLGLTDTEAPDEAINYYIEEAQQDMLKDLAVYVFEEVTNVAITITTANNFIADKNFDFIANSPDVEVYGWTDGENPATKTTLAVSTVYPNNSKIVLTSAPATTITKITVSYYHFNGLTVYDQFPEACAILSAYYYAQAELALIPDQWMHGAYRFRIGSEYKSLYNEYLKKLDKIKGRWSDRGSHDETTLIRGG